MCPNVVYYQNPFLACPYGSLPWLWIKYDMKYENYYNPSQTYLFLLSSSIDGIWVWDCLGYEIWTWMVSWNGYGSTCWIYTWKLNNHVYWLVTSKLIWRMGRKFVWSFNWCTGWLDDWYWRRIFCWIITETPTWNPRWISKP